MTATVPRETRRIVWELYLGGKTLDLIADLTGISKTSVFNIVQDMASHDPDYVLMRTLAVNLRKNGSDLSQYASIIRISSLLEEYGVDYATGEDLTRKISFHMLQTPVGTFSRCACFTKVFTVCRKIWTYPNGARKFF